MVKIEISGDQYQKCFDGSNNMWCSNKKGVYGKGILNTTDDPRKVERIGNLGEMAFALYMGIEEPKFEYIKGGDKYDFLINDKTVNVKCASKNYGAVLIKCKTESGKDCFKPADYFVASYILSDDKDKKEAIVNIVGWADLKYVLTLTPKDSTYWRSKHKNYELLFENVKSIDKLKRLLL